MKKVEIGLFLFLVSILTVQAQINTNETKVDSTIIIEKKLNKEQFKASFKAQAFVAATFMHKEYGDISAWYSIGAYTLATSVGVLRVLNNRHYASDILIGASIGILSTQLAYLTHQYKWSKKKESKLVLLPTYDQANLGFYMCFTF